MELLDELSTLTIFNQRVELILSFRMVQTLLFERHTNYKLIAPDYPVHPSGTAFTGGSADAESTHALANNLRLFYQQNDAVGIAELTRVYESGKIDPALAREYGAIKADLNRKLDSPSMVQIPGGIQRTHRDYLEIYLYGDLSHTDRQADYEQVAGRHPLFNMLSRVEFDRSVRYLLRAIVEMKAINVRAIEDLSRMATNSI